MSRFSWRFPKARHLWRSPAYRGVILIVFFATLGVLLLPFGNAAHAELESSDFINVGNGLIWGVAQMLLLIASLFLKMTVFFLRLLMELAAYNGYIDSPPVIVGWYMIRDVANMFFVVALLAIAFGTILGLENYEWKTPRSSSAAIFINFSRLICQLLIDAAHVFTITFSTQFIARPAAT